LSEDRRKRGEWRSVVLGEALRLNCHSVTVEAKRSFNIAGVYSFGRGLFERGVLEGPKTSYKVLHELRSGQLVMSRLKAWEGALALVSPGFDGMFLSPEFPTFDIDPELLDPEFLDSLLTSETFWGRLRGASKGIGARKERVSAERLLEQAIEIPSVAEQRVIAERLERLGMLEGLELERSTLISALVPSMLNREFAGVM
jgi:type I restriction enzyme S subunit